MIDLEDSHYIKKVLQGHAASFKVLVKRHQSLAYTLALRIAKNHEDAEEIAQDAFLKAYDALRTFKHESKFSTWLYQIVYRTAISKLRKKGLDYTPLDELQNVGNIHVYQIGGDKNNLEGFDALHVQERKKIILEAIARLKENESVVLTLFYLSEQSIREIEKITGYSISNIKTLLHRGRNSLLFELKKILKGEIIDML